MTRRLDLDPFEACRPRLISIAYRMLGERSAAEDVVQDAWLRWQSVDTSKVINAEAWLTRATTRIAIDALRKIRTRREHYIGPWLPEPILDDPGTDFTERLEISQEAELALLWAMESLKPEERAALILRDAFDTDYGAIAAALDRSVAACRQLVSRARRKTETMRYVPDVSNEAVMELLAALLKANASGDVDRIAALLASDVVAISDGGGKVRAALRPLYGAAETAQVMHALAERKPPSRMPDFVMINGRPAIAILDGGEGDFITTILPSATQAGRIGWIYTMRNPDKMQRP